MALQKLKEYTRTAMPLRIHDIFCCPQCRAPLQSDGDTCGAHCSRCGAAYAFREGILDLNPVPTEEASQEMEAHHALEARWMDLVPDELRDLVVGEAGEQLALVLPRLTHPDLARIPTLARFAENADDFFELLDWMRIRPGEVILEIGAHTGWASHHIARCGAQVIATDISHQLADTALFLRQGIPMLRAYADMTALPVLDGVLDTIFAVATIHHAEDLPGLFASCSRALAPGGRCVFFSEPVAGKYDAQIKEEFGAEDKAMGVHEHIYTIDEYFAAARAAGLRPAVLPLKSILRDKHRRYRLFRSLWLALLHIGIGRHPLFTRHVYRVMLRFYPRIPFPHLALVFTKPRQENE